MAREDSLGASAKVDLASAPPCPCPRAPVFAASSTIAGRAGASISGTTSAGFGPTATLSASPSCWPSSPPGSSWSNRCSCGSSSIGSCSSLSWTVRAGWHSSTWPGSPSSPSCSSRTSSAPSRTTARGSSTRRGGRANAHEFIERLPEVYDTLIGERGVKLSGGQCQRLAIARAILAEPRILILDEATSNLDTESEQLIQESLADLLGSQTTFVIAHRLSTIRRVHLILLMEDGRIIERRSHQELMEARGVYHQMVLRQLEAAGEGDAGGWLDAVGGRDE
ncbi:MAG TPA: ATP-binding cassette domain-containing protein [Gemmatimonadales bacterium]|nr:ATP-binding cassette domain-containing protein [Gemmatimonadales bacterium]